MPELRQVHLRHASHYEDVLRAADQSYEEGGEAVSRALQVFDLEWRNIEGGYTWAALHINDDKAIAKLCCVYPIAGKRLLYLRQHPRDRIKWLEVALVAARILNERKYEGMLLDHLGSAYMSVSEVDRARELYKQSLAIRREVRDRYGEGTLLNNLGNTYLDSDDTRAIELYDQALGIAVEIDSLRSKGDALGNMAHAYKNLDDLTKAIDLYERSLNAYATIGDRYNECIARIGLADAYDKLQRTDRAIELYEQSLLIARELNLPRDESKILLSLGQVYCRMDNNSLRAVDLFEAALLINRGLGDRQSEGRTLGSMSFSYDMLGEFQLALELNHRYLVIATEVSNKRDEGRALWNRSLLLEKVGKHAEAITHAAAALKIKEEIRDPRTLEVRNTLERWRKGDK